MGIKHTYQSATPNDPGDEISSSRWNEDHNIDGPLHLPLETTSPSPLTNVLKLFAQRRASRSLLRMVGQSGVDVSLQPALFGNDIRLWAPNTTTTVIAIGQPGLTNIHTGTGAAIATPTPAATNEMTAMRRFQLGTGTVAGNTAGVRDPIAWYHRGSGTGRGGWFHHTRFGIEATAADIQVMVGYAASTTALAGDPSALVNCAMLGKDSADANWQFMHNDASGVATKVNTGAAVTANQVLDFFMFAPPFGSSVFFELRNALTGAVLATHEATTDLPVNTTFLVCRASIRAPTSTTARQLSIGKVYNETGI
jgi:hypothetical protein